ncbi:MAG: Gfo/Idh/MocA family oxidoreductase [Actinomycetota bacterium]|nr:Gfo/Idh/MocA family oxidoreductase [Actinomycetota bacterium]
MTPLRTAIVGSGFVARVHAAAVRDLGGTIVAVCSRTQAGADQLAEELGGVDAYESLAELLRGVAVDVVHVCTPNAVHAEQTMLALEHGAHVVCEKPLATSTDESERMLAALAASGRIGAVAYHVRGYPLVEHMRATVEAGEVGDLRVVHGRYVCDDALLVAEGWRLEPASSGPTYVTADLGAHWFDLAEHVTGARVSEVLADFRTFVPGRMLDDHSSLLLRFDNGAAGTAVFSALSAGRKNQLLFELEGSKGGFTWDQESPNELLHRHAEEPTQIVIKIQAPTQGGLRQSPGIRPGMPRATAMRSGRS